MEELLKSSFSHVKVPKTRCGVSGELNALLRAQLLSLPNRDLLYLYSIVTT